MDIPAAFATAGPVRPLGPAAFPAASTMPGRVSARRWLEGSAEPAPSRPPQGDGVRIPQPLSHPLPPAAAPGPTPWRPSGRAAASWPPRWRRCPGPSSPGRSRDGSAACVRNPFPPVTTGVPGAVALACQRRPGSAGSRGLPVRPSRPFRFRSDAPAAFPGRFRPLTRGPAGPRPGRAPAPFRRFGVSRPFYLSLRPGAAARGPLPRRRSRCGVRSGPTHPFPVRQYGASPVSGWPPVGNAVDRAVGNRIRAWFQTWTLPGSFPNRIVPTPAGEAGTDAAGAGAYGIRRVPGGFRPPGRRGPPDPVHGTPWTAGSGRAGGNFWWSCTNRPSPTVGGWPPTPARARPASRGGPWAEPPRRPSAAGRGLPRQGRQGPRTDRSTSGTAAKAGWSACSAPDRPKAR